MTWWLLVVGAIVIAVAVVSVRRRVRQIRTLMRAEDNLVELMLRDELLRQRLYAYWEAVDRHGGEIARQHAQELATALAARLRATDEGEQSVMEALLQPSETGRARYVEKIADEVTREMEVHGDLTAVR